VGAGVSGIVAPHNWLIHGIIERGLRARLARYATGRLLDIGCGIKPYRSLAAPYVSEHIGVEHASTPHGLDVVDIIATAYDIPLDDASVDTVLCTDVLEHLEEPAAAIREAARVLRPGGHAIYTVPLLWHLHEEPRDFYRYTPHGLRYLMEKAGLQVVSVTPLSGFAVTFSQEFVYVLQLFARGGRWNHRANPGFQNTEVGRYETAVGTLPQ
jgi:SAM-dependent methyltransferase